MSSPISSELEKVQTEIPCPQLSSLPLETATLSQTQHDNITAPPLPIIHEAALLRRLDWKLIPWLSLLYFLSYLDRTSIGNAKLYNMEADLGITDQQYLLALSILFIPVALLEVPSNLLLKQLQPRIWFSFIMLMWGIVMTMQGLVHNFGGLMTARWWLGFWEAGLFPGVTYYLSCWYKRSELGIRTAVFCSAVTFSGAFGGLLSAAISNMAGIGGKPAWAWIFIVEGSATVIAGAASFWVVEDFPDTARFLSEEERNIVIRRLQEDNQFSAGGETFDVRYVMQSLRDWKTWLGILMNAGVQVPTYASALFMPSIVSQLGYTATSANLLTVPVYVWACLMTCMVGYLADRWKTRGVFSLIFLSLSAAGYIILIFSRNATLSYFGVYLSACIYPLTPNTMAFIANNVEGSYKRAVSLAMAIGFGNLNAIVSSNIYRAEDEPWYTMGHGIVLMYIIMCFIVTTLMMILLRRENAARDRGERDEIIGEKQALRDNKNGVFESVADARRVKGDDWSGYRYTT